MREVIDLDGTPYEEDCAQVGRDDYKERAMKELRAFTHQLTRLFGEAPEGVRVYIKSNPHDFGTYHTLAISFDEDDEVGSEWAYNVDSNIPAEWDAEALTELGIVR
jgi:hypothetical protein